MSTPAQRALRIADRFADPDAVPAQLTVRPWWRQSLAHGAPGLTLLHVEAAAHGLRPWRRAHDWIAYLASCPSTTGPAAHLYHGAPALAHVLSCATTQQSRCYQQALHTLDRDITIQTRRRVDAAHARIDRGDLVELAEFDLIRGLTGLGAYLLRRDPTSAALREGLAYLVRLCEPIRHADETLPGWWTGSSPTGRPSPRFVGGHANTGIAHGIAGPLALLSLAARNGVVVDGQHAAIARILAWLDQWRVDTDTRPRWPYWVNRSQLRAGRRDHLDPRPHAWCYGTAGLLRSQHLAALATVDVPRQHQAEQTLIDALHDHTTESDTSLCHGSSGLVLAALSVAADADPATAARLLSAIPPLAEPSPTDAADAPAVAGRTPGGEYGLLEGDAGLGLAALALDRSVSLTGWHSCLLLT